MRSAGWSRAWSATNSRWRRIRSRAGLLDYPHYTRPAEFAGMKVPDVLLSGHHADVRRWRRKTALARTLDRRPELLERAVLDDEDRKLLDEILKERGPKGGHPRRNRKRPTFQVGPTEGEMSAIDMVEKSQMTERPR